MQAFFKVSGISASVPGMAHKSTAMSFRRFSHQLETEGTGIWPGFLTPGDLRDVRADFDLVHDSHRFQRASTGQGEDKKVRDLVRRDEVHWLERGDSAPAQSMLWAKFDSLKRQFNRHFFLGLSGFEGHYAAYPAGGFYKRHVDCFQRDNARVISLILYLNMDWKPCDGGRLRLYGADSHFDINPVGGTVVCFMSSEKEHEVLPSHAKRASLAGWFKR